MILVMGMWSSVLMELSASPEAKEEPAPITVASVDHSIPIDGIPRWLETAISFVGSDMCGMLDA